jgi:hypothetical protein
VVGHQHDLLGQVVQQRDHAPGVAPVQQRGRLVADEQCRLGHQHGSQGEELLLPAGEQVRGVVGTVRQPVRGERRVHPGPYLRTRQPGPA